MKFHPTPIDGAFIVELNKLGDERGFFARLFCAKEFEEHGLPSSFVQANNSLSADKGTLRGMHYQLAPDSECKVVRCIKGSLFDVVLDIRPNSPSFGKWYGHELTAENRMMMIVPEGCAHGFLTLEDETEAFYFVSTYYSPKLERGIRWNDPKFNIQWPITPLVVSDKDNSHPDFDPCYHLYQAEPVSP